MTNSAVAKNAATNLTPEKSAGFTLMEILIALAIIAILSAISFPVYKSYIDKAKRTVSISTLETARKTLEDYHISYGGYPLTIDFSTGVDAQGQAVLPPALLEEFKTSLFSVDSYTATAADYTLTARAMDTNHIVLVLTPGQVVTQGP